MVKLDPDTQKLLDKGECQLLALDVATCRQLLAESSMRHGTSITLLNAKIDEAIGLVISYGGIDGDHHKLWVLDQMVRALAGGKYDLIVAEAKAGEDGPETYEWDCGIAP